MKKKSLSKRRRNNNHLTPEELQARRAAAHSGMQAMAMLKSVAATPKVQSETLESSPRRLTAVSPGTPWHARLPQFARYNRETSPST